MGSNNGKKENTDKSYDKAFDLIREKDPSLIEDIIKAISSDNRDMDFTLSVAMRISMLTPLLSFSKEIQLYLKRIQIGLLHKSSELYPKGIAPYLHPYAAEISAYSEA